jgi:hypothetical protein
MSSALELSIAINLEDLLSIESQWQELWLDSPCGTPFQSPAWLIPFVRIFSPAEIRVLLIWRKDQLVGLFPFWIERGLGPFTIKILGHGISDYLDALGREAQWHNLPPLIEAWLNQELGSEGSVEFGQLKQNALLASVPRAGIFICSSARRASCRRIGSIHPQADPILLYRCVRSGLCKI